MPDKYIRTGTLTDARTVALDEPLPLESVKVRLIIEPLRPASKRPHLEVLKEIYSRQKARGHQPPTREAVDAYIQAERSSWGE